jgi:hypothetical protein
MVAVNIALPKSRFVQVAAGIAVLCCTLVGCGGDGFDRVPLSGTVTFEGDASRSGFITATPATAGTGAPTATAVIENGKFSFPLNQGPIAGSYIFEVNLNVPDKLTPTSGDQSRPEDANETGATQVTYQKTLDVPAEGNSGFAIEVTSADQRVGGSALPPSGEI